MSVPRPELLPSVSVMPALRATVVVVAPSDRLTEAADVMQSLRDAGAVRGVLISEGTNPTPPARVAGSTITLAELNASYIDNAVAALRLSSLPTLVWWRGGRAETLETLVDLAERVVLDEDKPKAGWLLAAALSERSAFTDLRWTRLTRWRALMAHFFDISEVAAATEQFVRLRVCGRDPISMSLFAGWLKSSLPLRAGFDVELRMGSTDAPIEEVVLEGSGQQLVLRRASTTCLESRFSVPGHAGASRKVSLGDPSLGSLLLEELRITSRDTAFERAMRESLSMLDTPSDPSVLL